MHAFRSPLSSSPLGGYALPRHGRSSVCLLARSLTVATRISPAGPRPANPCLDPKDDPYNSLRYIASDVLAGLAFGAYVHSKSMCLDT